MPHKLLHFTRRYRDTLSLHLDDGKCASLEMADGLGALGLLAGMDAVQLAKLHGKTVALQLGPECQAGRRTVIVKRGGAFFLAAIARPPKPRGAPSLPPESVTGLIGGLVGHSSRLGGVIVRLRLRLLRRRKFQRSHLLISKRFDTPRRLAVKAASRKNAHVVLTRRQTEVLTLIAGGSTNKEVAARLGISLKTAEKHREHIMKKLDIHETAGLTRYAMRQGMVG